MDAVIVPEPGKEKETLRLLLAMADKPRHVKLNHDEAGTYFVPEYLAEKYNTAVEAREVQEDPKAQAAPKRRGRPPGSRTKAAQAADDQDGEE